MGRAASLAVALLLTSAAAADAGTVAAPGGGAAIFVVDSPGSAQFLNLAPQGDVPSGFLFRFEPDALQAGAGCRQVRPTEITCDGPSGRPVDLQLGDAPDYLDAQRHRWALLIDGGPGDSRRTVSG